MIVISTIELAAYLVDINVNMSAMRTDDKETLLAALKSAPVLRKLQEQDLLFGEQLDSNSELSKVYIRMRGKENDVTTMIAADASCLSYLLTLERSYKSVLWTLLSYNMKNMQEVFCHMLHSKIKRESWRE
jgi:hypothetical protein